jgi:hypothetical protein
MNFNDVPIDKLINTSNQDYDIEVWWYGFKQLITNYFSVININIQLTNLSNNLNQLQIDKNYCKIYNDIYNFIILFLDKVSINRILNKHTCHLIITWLKRYNQIKDINIISLNNNYTSKSISDITPIENTQIQFYIRCYEIEYNINDKDLVKLYLDNFNIFMDYCIKHNIAKLINMFSLIYNLQPYYNYLNIDKKYVPIKGSKLIVLLKKLIK